MSFRSFHHSFQRSPVIGELLAAITPLDFFSGWVVAFRDTPQPAFAVAGSTWILVGSGRRRMGCSHRIIFRALAAVDALVGMGAETDVASLGTWCVFLVGSLFSSFLFVELGVRQNRPRPRPPHSSRCRCLRSGARCRRFPPRLRFRAVLGPVR